MPKMSEVFEEWRRLRRKHDGVPNYPYLDFIPTSESRALNTKIEKSIADRHNNILSIDGRVVDPKVFIVYPRKRYKGGEAWRKGTRDNFKDEELEEIIRTVEAIDPDAKLEVVKPQSRQPKGICESLSRISSKPTFGGEFHAKPARRIFGRDGGYMVEPRYFGSIELGAVDKEKFKQFLDALAPEYGIKTD